jgi:hypothetical protein
MLLTSSETLSEIVRGKGATNCGRLICVRLMSHIYENHVEIGKWLIARILSVYIIFINSPGTIAPVRSGHSASLLGLHRSHMQLVRQLLWIILKYYHWNIFLTSRIYLYVNWPVFCNLSVRAPCHCERDRSIRIIRTPPLLGDSAYHRLGREGEDVNVPGVFGVRIW